MGMWFTADTHFGHANVIRYCQRPFSTVQEMDEAIIDNWNRLVGSDDTVYHLGDFTLAGQEKASQYFSLLNGKISVVPGGHDKKWLRKGEYASKSGHPVIILPPLHTIKLSVPNLE